MTDFTEEQLDAIQGKPRPRGSLPYLPGDRSPAFLRAWLTRALRPPSGWHVERFERFGRTGRDPCTLYLANGRESKRFRFARQIDLARNSRTAFLSESDAWLDVPHLTGGEIEDVWAALCRLGSVLSDFDEVEQTREWVEMFLPVTLPLRGYSLVPDARHDALMALRNAGTFGKAEALSMIRPTDNGGPSYQQRPSRFIDEATGEQWVRPNELASYLRYVVGVEPLSHATLRARLREIGVAGQHFEDYRPPHPKLALYQLTDGLIESVADQ
jgi:hypothetical protein